jgi:hypothetical protein
MGDEQHRAPVAPGVRRLFEPIRIGGVEIPNRIVSTTHGTGLGPDRDLRYLEERRRTLRHPFRWRGLRIRAGPRTGEQGARLGRQGPVTSER